MPVPYAEPGVIAARAALAVPGSGFPVTVNANPGLQAGSGEELPATPQTYFELDVNGIRYFIPGYVLGS